MDSAIEVQSCSRCRSDSIVHQPYSGQHLCGKHLSSSIRKRTSKELRIQLDLPKDATRLDGNPFRILVAISGGKDSAVLLSMMSDIIGRRRDIELIAVCVDEGIKGYRAPSMEFAKELAESLGVRFETMGYEEMGYERMDKSRPDDAIDRAKAQRSKWFDALFLLWRLSKTKPQYHGRKIRR